MDDQSKMAEINDLIEAAHQAGPQKLYLAVSIANGIEDQDDRTSYFGIIVENLAQIGSLTDVEQAIGLARQTRPIDKRFAFAAIVARLIAEKQNVRAFAILAETAQAAAEFEMDESYEYYQKADWWRELGDSYRAIGDPVQARIVWLRAVQLARIGLTSLSPQDALGSRHALAETKAKLMEAGYGDDARETTV